MARLILNREKLIEYMEENNLSEQKLADLIGVDYTMVYRVLRGKRNPGPKFVAGILKNTKLNFNDIFFISNLPEGGKKNSQHRKERGSG